MPRRHLGWRERPIHPRGPPREIVRLGREPLADTIQKTLGLGGPLRQIQPEFAFTEDGKIGDNLVLSPYGRRVGRFAVMDGDKAVRQVFQGARRVHPIMAL